MTVTSVYQDRLKRVRVQSAVRVTAAWDMLPNYDRNQAEPFARAVVPVVTAGQLLASKLTRAHLRRRGLDPPPVDPLAVTGSAVREGVEPVEVYQRPFGLVWGALAGGTRWVDAVKQGRDRLDVLVATDVLLSTKATVGVVAEQYGDVLTGWQRVADGGACDLCSAENGAVYGLAGDMPIHPHCGCTLEPVYEDIDRTADNPSATTVHVTDEIGPVLYESGHAFHG